MVSFVQAEDSLRRPPSASFALGFLVGVLIAAPLTLAIAMLLLRPHTASPASTSRDKSIEQVLAGQKEHAERIVEAMKPAAAIEVQRSDPSVAALQTQIQEQQQTLQRLQSSLNEFLEQDRQAKFTEYEELLAAGSKLHLAGQYKAACSEYAKALRLNPKGIRALLNRGLSRQELGQWEPAMRDFVDARDLDPGQYVPWNNIAWLQATCPDSKIRDGAKAVENAEHCCELTDWNNYVVLSTLAAALAESGEFDAAQMRLQQAIDLAPDKVKEQFNEPLSLYQSGQPFRMTPSE